MSGTSGANYVFDKGHVFGGNIRASGRASRPGGRHVAVAGRVAQEVWLSVEDGRQRRRQAQVVSAQAPPGPPPPPPPGGAGAAVSGEAELHQIHHFEYAIMM